MPGPRAAAPLLRPRYQQTGIELDQVWVGASSGRTGAAPQPDVTPPVQPTVAAKAAVAPVAPSAPAAPPPVARPTAPAAQRPATAAPAAQRPATAAPAAQRPATTQPGSTPSPAADPRRSPEPAGPAAPTRAAASARPVPRPTAPAISRTADDAATGPSEVRRVDPRIVVLAVIVAAVLVLGGVFLVNRPKHHSAPPSVADTNTAAAATWAAANVPKNARLLADVSSRAALLDKGLPADTVVAYFGALDPTTVQSLNFVVDSATMRAPSSTSDAVLGKVLDSSAVVAQFGAGSTRVEIRQVLGNGAAGIAETRSANSSAQQVAGKSLASNPHIVVDPAAAPALQAGRLDMRPATVLVMLAATGQVQVLELPQDPAEAAAGVAIRTVHLKLADPASLTALTSSLPAAYRPATTTQLTDGGVRLTWPPNLAVIPPVN